MEKSQNIRTKSTFTPFFTALSWPEVLPQIPVNFLELAKRRIPYKYLVAETGVGGYIGTGSPPFVAV